MASKFTLTVEHDSGRVEKWSGTVQSIGYDSGEPFSRVEVTSADMHVRRNLSSPHVDEVRDWDGSVGRHNPMTQPPDVAL